MGALPPVPTYLVLMALSAIENVFPPAPADVAVALGAFLARQGQISPFVLWALCWLANTVTAAGMYVLGRTHGEALMHSPWTARFMPRSARDGVREAYARFGAWGIFASRFLPGLRAAVTPFAGVFGIPAARVLVPAALASAIWYALIVAAGYQLGTRWEAVSALLGDANRALAIVALVAAGALVVWIGRRTRSAR
jgi:membrane protein DedA with SNARE-associated domain